jgi:dinuclear metal center YbgI/SA1388 family protein
MRVADLIAAMESIAPSALAEEWDNVGLILGDRQAALAGPVLLAIDLTPPVVAEAIKSRAGAIVAYHPPIFRPTRSLTAHSPHGRALLDALEARIAIYSPHTALDACAGGVADWLIDQVATPDARPGAGKARAAISAHTHAEPSQAVKIVTFVPAEPPDVLERVRAALAQAGAGRIGQYEQCSFVTPGQGSFKGGASTNPKVGERGRLEFVAEHRLEKVCSLGALPAAIAALRATHPYEEPAFDIYPLAPKPRADLGPGRILTIEKAATPKELAARLKKALALPAVQLASAAPDSPVSRIAVCPGSGESLLDAAASAGAQLFITGEMKHHETLGALERGCSVILAGHTETERGYLPTLAKRLNDANPAFKSLTSREDRSPISMI